VQLVTRNSDSREFVVKVVKKAKVLVESWEKNDASVVTLPPIKGDLFAGMLCAHVLDRDLSALTCFDD
jgi:hypothetical protein